MQAETLSLKEAVIDALNNPDDLSKAKKAHASFLRESMLMPVHQNSEDNSEPNPLFLEDNGMYFLPVFSEQAYFSTWAEDVAQNIDLLRLTGNDLIKGTKDNVYICLDIGQPHYKQFSPEEINQLRSVVSKLDSLIKRNKKV